MGKCYIKLRDLCVINLGEWGIESLLLPCLLTILISIRHLLFSIFPWIKR